MTAAVILFAIAAVGGVVMAIIRFSGKSLPPIGLALLHGVVAAAGLVALIITVVSRTASTTASYALGGFVVAALGGFFLFSFHLRKQALPITIMIIHALVAVVSFVILLLATFAAGA
ncbi:MAG TPA: hypothetical protein VFV34_15255 [Blastocatellia bacterium]|nr:hypothetical protein [Blastocatellia bacterium]